MWWQCAILNVLISLKKYDWVITLRRIYNPMTIYSISKFTTIFVIRLLLSYYIEVQSSWTCWIKRIDISGGSAECCLKASWFCSRYVVEARVDYKEQCGLVATSHTFIPSRRKGIKWKHSSLFVVIPFGELTHEQDGRTQTLPLISR